jgi:hypothetical protein
MRPSVVRRARRRMTRTAPCRRASLVHLYLERRSATLEPAACASRRGHAEPARRRQVNGEAGGSETRGGLNSGELGGHLRGREGHGTLNNGSAKPDPARHANVVRTSTVPR